MDAALTSCCSSCICIWKMLDSLKILQELFRKAVKITRNSGTLYVCLPGKKMLTLFTENKLSQQISYLQIGMLTLSQQISPQS